MSLKKYHQKRNFKKTKEPEEEKKFLKKFKNSFVIQKHNAQNLHYDFRLEIDEVFKSWAIPKGPSLNPSKKRLAINVEDHPLSYGDFEGNIPENEYGGGTVIVWDRGKYKNLKDETIEKCFKKGLKVKLR